jgi:hypothetical protein
MLLPWHRAAPLPSRRTSEFGDVDRRLDKGQLGAHCTARSRHRIDPRGLSSMATTRNDLKTPARRLTIFDARQRAAAGVSATAFFAPVPGNPTRLIGMGSSLFRCRAGVISHCEPVFGPPGPRPFSFPPSPGEIPVATMGPGWFPSTEVRFMGRSRSPIGRPNGSHELR